MGAVACLVAAAVIVLILDGPVGGALQDEAMVAAAADAGEGPARGEAANSGDVESDNPPTRPCSGGGSTVPDVRLMKASIPDTMKVKASGGMHSWQEAVDMVEAGASRLGTSSTLAILEGAPA